MFVIDFMDFEVYIIKKGIFLFVLGNNVIEKVLGGRVNYEKCKRVCCGIDIFINFVRTYYVCYKY